MTATDDALPQAELTLLLGLAFQLLLGEFNDRLAQAGYPGLRPVHGLAFQALRPAGATSTELAERLGVTKQAAGQLVDDLERRGYVTRHPHPAGGRRRLIVLTDTAHRHLETAGRLLRQLEEELGDTAALRAELTRLIRHFTGDTAPPPLRPVW